MSASLILSREEKERESSSTGVPLLQDSGEDDFLTEQRHETEDGFDNAGVVVLQNSKNGPRVSFFRRHLTAILVFTILVLLVFSLILAVLLARKNCTVNKVVKPKNCLSAGCIGKASYMLKAMDRNANPCNDFFQYSCGGWQKSQRIPESKAFWGIFSSVWQHNQALMKGLLEDIVLPKTKNSAAQKVKVYYDACMNMTEVNRVGKKPLVDVVNNIGGWVIANGKKNRSFEDDGKNVLKIIHKDYGVGVFFSIQVHTDDKNSSRNVIVVSFLFYFLSQFYF